MGVPIPCEQGMMTPRTSRTRPETGKTPPPLQTPCRAGQTADMPWPLSARCVVGRRFEMMGAEEKAEVLKSPASTVSKEIEFLRTLQLVAQGQGKFIPEACPELELQRGPAARIVDCDDTTSELELQRGPAARIVHCDTTIEQHAFETPNLLHRARAARTETETMPSRQEPKELPMNADDENLVEGVGVADVSKAIKLCRQRSLVISATSEAAEAPFAAVGSAVSPRTAASTSSLRREVLMPWEKSKWLAFGARPAMKATSQGSLRQVAGLRRLTGASACMSLSSARSLPTCLRDGEAAEHDVELNMGSFTSFGSASSLASTVASPQRRDQPESSSGGLTRQRNSNALHRSTAERCSVIGSGGSATTHSARRTRRRRHNNGLLREGGVAVSSAPLLAL